MTEEGIKLPPIAIDLVADYPQCFNWDCPRPLKIGIRFDLTRRMATDILTDIAAQPEVQQLPIRIKDIRKYAYFWVGKILLPYCKRPEYLKCLQLGATRIDLEGQPAGTVNEQDVRYAQEMLASPVEPPRPTTPHPSHFVVTLPNHTLLAAENIVSGRLELTVKFSQLPEAVRVKSGFKIGIQTDNLLITATLPTRAWNRLQKANNEWPLWMAALSGQYGSQVKTALGPMLVLEKPALQVFEKKPKAKKQAAPAAQPSTPATADQTRPNR